MKAKVQEKKQSILMRKEGHSLSEISEGLGVAKSTVSLWVKDIELSEKAESIIQAKKEKGREKASASIKLSTDSRIKNAFLYADKILSGVEINPDTARLLCALLYWCEGTKIRRSNMFGFTNSDPDLVKEFMRLFREGFDIDESKLRLTLHVHEYHDSDAQLQFWSKMTNIPLSQCHRPYLKPHTAKRTREGYQGCVTIRYYDVEVARQLDAIAITYLRKK